MLARFWRSAMQKMVIPSLRQKVGNFELAAEIKYALTH